MENITDLIKRFESDILHDCHSYESRFRRSAARKALEEKGATVLEPIHKHLTENTPSSFMDLSVAWGELLCQLCKSAEIEFPSDLPFSKTEEWILLVQKSLK